MIWHDRGFDMLKADMRIDIQMSRWVCMRTRYPTETQIQSIIIISFSKLKNLPLWFESSLWLEIQIYSDLYPKKSEIRLDASMHVINAKPEDKLKSTVTNNELAFVDHYRWLFKFSNSYWLEWKYAGYFSGTFGVSYCRII